MSLPNIQHEQELDQILTTDNEVLLAFLIEDNRGSASVRQALEQALSAHPDGHEGDLLAKFVEAETL